MDSLRFIAHLRSLPDYAGEIIHVETIPRRTAEHGQLDRPLDPTVERMLRAGGIRRLYRHQAESINAIRDGEHVMVTTGTASGKTLCYNVPVLDSIMSDPLSRSLYLFPTKALAQDQVRSLRALTDGHFDLRLGTYDGDTLPTKRRDLRRRASIVLSNPDMLHMGILPNHTSWASFFKHLRFIVLDEAHVYRGIFGSHIACLLRRLWRVCELYGTQPQYVLCSATIANPREHAARLTGHEVAVIDRDGAPQGTRFFCLWNAPPPDDPTAKRPSINSQATRILAELVKHEIRTIVFTRSRRVAELLLMYARNILRREQPDLVDRVSAYRGGYTAEERRVIERRLFEGDLMGVTATNALELGIDVGHLHATMLVGYPGTIASMWQQAGRAGRGAKPSLSILMGQDNPLDQFYMRHPDELFGRSPEHALIDPGNYYVLRGHLPCAAFESPITPEDEALFGEGHIEAMVSLEQDDTLDYRNNRWYLTSDDYPAQRVNIRATSGNTYLLVDETNNYRTLEHLDAASAFFRVYPGAIHLHHGRAYSITHLDIEAQVAYARPAKPDYYTQVLELNDVHIIKSLDARQLEATDVYFGLVRVREQVIGFRRVQQYTDTLLSEEKLDLPPTSFETQALWFGVPDHAKREVVHQRLDYAGGLHAIEHACIGILPSFTMCDRNDIGGLSTPEHPDTGRPQIFVYDGYPGGVGITKKGFDLIQDFWKRTLRAIEDCPCDAGCPSCIQSPKCGNNNTPLDKQAAIVLLRKLVYPQKQNAL